MIYVTVIPVVSNTKNITFIECGFETFYFHMKNKVNSISVPIEKRTYFNS